MIKKLRINISSEDRIKHLRYQHGFGSIPSGYFKSLKELFSAAESFNNFYISAYRECNHGRVDLAQNKIIRSYLKRYISNFKIMTIDENGSCLVHVPTTTENLINQIR